MDTNENKAFVSNDLTTNSTGDTAENTRTPAFAEGTTPTSGNTGWEKFITARFARFEDAEKAHEILKDIDDFDMNDLIVSRIDGGIETAYSSFSDLKDDLKKNDVRYNEIGMGIKTAFRENEDNIKRLWHDCNAVWTNA